ncbi:hypothetical protein [Nocardia thraciensis]
MECHLTVQLDDGAPLHYRADRRVAEAFAAAAAYLAQITIDDHVRTWMPQLPCQSLWQ